ncbi:Primary amine oxidase [Vitis vinifera]|uniref:Amine oxidase n=1 Tax=Vitis vinifera TaxID=29760 RepID=A0A438ESI4_VITVI|nr:Primary amine oxidase [Vitis vinifera]
MDDIQVALRVPLSDPEFNKSIMARGVKLSDLGCISPSSGWFGPDEEGRRIIKIQCGSIQDTANFYMRPIEGLTVTVDIDRKEVATRNGANQSNFNGAAQGPSFRVEDGHIVKWANWEFHLKADQRTGMIISQAKVRDSETGELRSVMYKGFASEMFVPYMDPDEAWYFKSYMDAGEFGLGGTALALVPLNDCPRNSYYMDGVFVASDGKPFIQSNMICVFERYTGDVGWRHSETFLPGFNIREARPKVTLVARIAASVGNYDYIFDWEFQTDGLIRVKVGLSGMLMVKGTPLENIHQAPNQDDMSGTLVSENVIGQSGEGRDSARPITRKSYLKAKRNVAATENDAKIKLKLYDPSEFHVINPLKRSRLGNSAGYKIVPSGTAASLLDLQDPPQLRSAFTNNQSKGEDTLAVWSDRNRPIENRDIVLCNPVLRAAPNFEKDLPVCRPAASS